MTVPQSDFTAALLDPNLATPDGLIDPLGRPAGKRFDVYRNNVVVSLLDAMETAFPAIQKMVGPEFFRAMAGQYVRQHPPTTPLLMFYGTAFPDFLGAFEPVAKYPYLPDVARLELVRRSAYHAADATAIEPEALSAIAPENLMESRVQLAPAMCLISSPFPIVSLWDFNMIEGAPTPVPAAQTALVTRPELDLEMRSIDAGTREFLLALQNQNTLAESYEEGLEANSSFDLSAALGVLLQTKIVTEIYL